MTFVFRFLPALSDPPAPWAPCGQASAQWAPEQRAVFTARARTKALPTFPNWLDSETATEGGYYPHCLISAYYFRDKHGLALPYDGYVLGDSGGFSLMRYDAHLDAADVLKWQGDVCSAGIILDQPPEDHFGNRFFDEALAVTVRNVKRAVTVWPQVQAAHGTFRWLGVCHGWNDTQRQRWWEAVSAVHPFTEWAFRAREPSSHPVAVAEVLHFIKQRSIHHAHFLAAGAPAALAVLSVLGPQAGLEWVTADAETAGQTARNRGVLRLTTDRLGVETVREVGEGRRVRDYLLNSCRCASCAALRADAERHPAVVHGAYGPYWTFRFYYHSVITQVCMAENITAAAVSQPDALLHLILGTAYSDTMNAFTRREAPAAA